jgi:hypothetical protein
MNWVCAQLCLVWVLILVKPAAKGFYTTQNLNKDKSYDVVISISYPNHFSFISCIHTHSCDLRVTLDIQIHWVSSLKDSFEMVHCLSGFK